MEEFKDEKPTEQSASSDGDFVVIREQIKSRPINKSRLMKNTLFAAVSAVVFGLVACVTFFLLAPFVSGYFEKDEEIEAPKIITFPEDPPEEEMDPGDMLLKDEPEIEIDYSLLAEMDEEAIANLISGIEFTISDYQKLYRSLASVASDTLQSMVSVKTVSTDTNWINDMFEQTDEVAGLIVAKENPNLYILTYSKVLEGNSELVVTFYNGVSARAELLQTDSTTGLCVIVVPFENINEVTLENLSVPIFGSSNSVKIVGTPIIAVGSPSGIYGSMNYGIVAGNSQKLYVPDNYYTRLITDIYGSKDATGVVVNVYGHVIGIIDTNFASKEMGNVIGAIGISELKRTLEKLTNDQESSYAGIVGADVPDEAILLYNAPEGTFVTSVEVDSPAMLAGIQSGDIITAFNNVSVTSYSDYIRMLRGTVPDTEVSVTISRSVRDGYKKMTIYFTTGKAE